MWPTFARIIAYLRRSFAEGTPVERVGHVLNEFFFNLCFHHLMMTFTLFRETRKCMGFDASASHLNYCRSIASELELASTRTNRWRIWLCIPATTHLTGDAGRYATIFELLAWSGTPHSLMLQLRPRFLSRPSKIVPSTLNRNPMHQHPTVPRTFERLPAASSKWEKTQQSNH